MSKGSSSFFNHGIQLRGILSACGYSVCLTTLCGFAGQFSWTLDLCSHFRVQYLAILTILCVLLLALCQRRTALIFLVFAVLNLATIIPFYCGNVSEDVSRVSIEATAEMRVLLLNVNSRSGNPEKVKKLIIETVPDLIVLEEISSRWIPGFAAIKASHPYWILQAREDNFGIAIFSKLPLEDRKVAYIGNAGVPTILTTVVQNRIHLRVIATHPLPPIGAEYSQWRNEQLDQLTDYVSASMPTILLGDLNTTPWSYCFARLLQQSGLKDSSRGHGIQPTWPSHNPLLRIPIDQFLHSAEIAILRRQTGPDVESDHYPVIVDFLIKTGNRSLI